MTAEEAREELKPLCAYDQTPKLDLNALDRILLKCRVVDAEGRAPLDDDYEGTYDLNTAAKNAWQEKMGLAASCTDFTSDGESRSRSQIMANCRTMRNTYALAIARSLPGYDASGNSLALQSHQVFNGPCGCD